MHVVVWLGVRRYSDAMLRDIITSGEIGAAIKLRRKELGLSQEQLAERVGVSYQQVQRYENGSSTLNVENVQRIARALALPVTAFFASTSEQYAPETLAPFWSPEEKTLLRHFRDISTSSDKTLAISVLRRFAKK